MTLCVVEISSINFKIWQTNLLAFISKAECKFKCHMF